MIRAAWICSHCKKQSQGVSTRGLCRPCYRKLSDIPGALAAYPRSRRKLPKDLRSRVFSQAVISPDGCWLWTGPMHPHGYGTVSTTGGAKERRTLRAHRAAYELYYGAIPEDLQLDHLCRVRRCINPAHLEPVTARENQMRSPITSASINAQKIECPNGHPYDDENTYITPSGSRNCRTCIRESAKTYQAKRRAKLK